LRGNETMDWIGKWIWGGDEESPRNAWRCFVKTFDTPQTGWTDATLRIAADSRYALYVNGVELGRGPSRFWPDAPEADCYDVGSRLVRGESNTIAVLVNHLGISNFQYIRGRGGLLAQLDLATGDDGSVLAIGTDATWLTSPHRAYERAAARISCQLGFVERYDATAADEAWTKQAAPSGDEVRTQLTAAPGSDWEASRELGPVGIAPWTNVGERTIPFLTMEPMKPRRITRLRECQPIAWSAALDMRELMVPGCESHADPVMYVGALVTVLRLATPGAVTIGFPDAPVLRGVSVDGVWSSKEQLTGTHPERYWQGTLGAGDHLILLDVGGWDHGSGFLFGIDSEAPFEVLSPSGSPDSPLVAFGPFDTIAPVSHPIPRELCETEPAYLLLKTCGAWEQIESNALLQPCMRPVSALHCALDDVFVQSVWKRDAAERPVSRQLEQAVAGSPNALRVPLPAAPFAETELLLDFGTQLSGYLAFELTASEGTVIDVYGFEYESDGWIQHTYSLNNTMRYACREGLQTYVSQVRRGCRYVLLTVRHAKRPVHIHDIAIKNSSYPVAETGAFQCSDALLNDIWRISRHTTKLCMEDTFVDCPAYEQTFWVGDSRNEALICYYLFGAEDLVERCLRLVPGSRSQTPLLANQVPSGWNSVIPNWTFFWIAACEEYYERTGKKDTLAELLPHIDEALKHYWALRDDRGLLAHRGWNFLDWAPIDQPNEGIVTHQNAVFVQALTKAARMAAAVGDTEKSERYNERAAATAQAINEHLWSEREQAYYDCLHKDGTPSSTFSMQIQVMAYLCGIAEGSRKSVMERYLRQPPETFVPIGSPFMSFFYYEALLQMGETAVMLDDIRRNYGEMLAHGATTCWETFASFQDDRQDQKAPSRSHCHAWSAAPGFMLGYSVLGVQPQEPGWTKVAVTPSPSGLQWAQGSVPLPGEGRIDVSWRISNEQERVIHVRVSAPYGISVDVRLPEGYAGDAELVHY
jgi:alpha-L-rhamnosidase